MDKRAKDRAVPDTKVPQVKPIAPKGAKKSRLTKQLRALIEEMAFKGSPLDIAAQQAGMKLQSAQKAFRKPHVRAMYNQLVTDIRENAAQEAYLGIRSTRRGIMCVSIRGRHILGLIAE